MTEIQQLNSSNTTLELDSAATKYIKKITKLIDHIFNNPEDYIETGDLRNELHRTKILTRFALFNNAKNCENNRVYHHTLRMINFIIQNKEILSKYFILEYLYLIILMHDLPENVTTDIPSNIKDHLSKETLEKIKQIERFYYERLFEKINLGNFKEDVIIDDLENKKSNEYNFLKFIDTIDGAYYYYFNIYKINNNIEPFEKYIETLNKYINMFPELLNEEKLKGTLLDRDLLINFLVEIKSIVANSKSTANKSQLDKLQKSFEKLNGEDCDINFFTK